MAAKAPRPAQGSVTVYVPEVLLPILEERVRLRARGMKQYFSLLLRAYRDGGPDARALTDLMAAPGNNRYQKSDLKLKRKSFTALDEDWGKLKALSARDRVSCSFLYVILFMFEAGLVSVRRDRVLVKSPEAREVLENMYPDIRTIALVHSAD